MAHIFISYSHQDSDYAYELEEALRQRGFDPWIDQRIDYGTTWPRVIQEQLDASSAVIVIMTPRAYDSQWVQNELAYAQGLEKPIFPLLLEGNFWLSVAAIHSLDVRNGRLPSKRFYDRLAQVVPPRTAALEVPATLVQKRLTQRAPTPAVEEKPKVLAPSEPEMILIPAGEFLMGSDPAKDREAEKHEQPQHNLYLPDYYIAKTPVTNAQYLAFVQAVDHRQPSHWKDGRPPRGKENHPVVYVYWSDANTYCRWLAETTGQPYHLPSEAEWEKAARGTDGRIYPWGETFDAALCNTIEAGTGGTTSVGLYSPGGDSPYGCADMAGNVLEWTRSLWGKDWQKADFVYPYDPKDGREDKSASGFRVLRGGTFYNAAGWVRCACRDGDSPDNWFRLIGFRVVVSPG